MLKTKSNEITDTHQAPCEAPETAEALRRSMWQAWLRSLLLFCCASAAQHFGIQAEQALTDTTNHFIQCFAAVEKRCLDSGRSLDTLTHGEWIEMWNRTKRSFEEEAADAIG